MIGWLSFVVVKILWMFGLIVVVVGFRWISKLMCILRVVINIVGGFSCFF